MFGLIYIFTEIIGSTGTGLSTSSQVTDEIPFIQTFFVSGKSMKVN